MTRRLLLGAGLAAVMGRAARKCEEVRRIPAAEANQGVAADEEFLYAVGNTSIGKYEKKSGRRVAGWSCERGKPLVHLDSGVVHSGVLHCAHSNYPGVPIVSSIESWDTRTMRPAGSFSFGIFAGSATWVDFRDGWRYVTFAHYKGASDEASRDPRWTTLMQFDAEWRQRQSWVYPETVVSRLGNFSISGGVFRADGKLWCTGHDNPEVYALRFPPGGSVLELEEIFAMPMKGQGIALDPVDASLLYGIDRATKQIVVTKVN